MVKTIYSTTLIKMPEMYNWYNVCSTIWWTDCKGMSILFKTYYI